jgi:hypothetical protein
MGKNGTKWDVFGGFRSHLGIFDNEMLRAWVVQQFFAVTC